MDRLTSLPSETLWHLLSYLTVQDLSCIRTVDKKLAVFADHPSHWRHLRLTCPPRSPPSTSQQQQLYDQDQTWTSTAAPAPAPASAPTSPAPPFSSSTTSMNLWRLKDLQRLVGPHRKIIESIEIWGVRDNIVRYILSQCMNLTEVTLRGWATLSDHAFKQLHSDLKLQRLTLVGAQEQPNYTALDATTLAHLLVQCPLKELSLGCQVHIHAETLLLELNKRQRRLQRQQQTPPPSSPPMSTTTTTTTAIPLSEKQQSHSTTTTFSKNRLHSEGSPLQLERLTLATRRTWSTEHVMALFDTCPSLHHVCLFPEAAAGGFDLTQTKEMGHVVDRGQQLI